MDLHRAALLTARGQWVEEQLFEMVGAWTADVGEPDVKRYFAVQSARHGWHAQLWEERQPTAAGLAVPDAPAGRGELGAALREVAGPDTTIEKLTALCRVLLPRLVTAYQDALAATDERLDGPTARVLTLILRDETEAWVEGEALLQRLVVTTPDVARAASVQTRLETILVTGGNLLG